MLDIQANLSYYADSGSTSQSVSSILSWDHVILPLGNFPPGYDGGPIPYSFNIRVEGSISGGGSFGNISATAGGGGYGTQGGQSISINQTYAGLAMPNTAISAALGAQIGLDASPYCKNSGGQIIVDPYIYIDPTWQYASNFGVFSPDKNGVWTQVNRDWMTPVPIPPAVWLLGSGLLGLVGLRRRFKK